MTRNNVAQVTLALAITLSGACTAGSLTGADGDGRFQGEIVVEPTDAPDPEALGGIWISTRPGAESLDHRVGLVLWPTTAIRVVDRFGVERVGSLDDLRVGAAIRAWTTEVEYFSIPPQYDATRIEVLERGA